MYCISDNGICILKKWRCHYLLYMLNSSQVHIGSLLYKWYIYEDMMPFGGEYVMICKRSMGNKFFIIFVKYVNYGGG